MSLGGEHFFLLVQFIIQPFILESDSTQPNLLRFPDDYVLDRFELLLLRQRQVFPGFVPVVALLFITQTVPDLIALRHHRELCQLIHDGIHLSLSGLF